jgi:DNA-binding response OmpR family regulator
MMMPERESIHQSDELTPLHLIEAGDRTALVCITGQALSETVAQVVQKLNYHVVVAQNSASALSRIDRDHYQLIVLEEGYGGTDLSTNPVLLYLQRLPMAVRRKSFLCLLSEQTPTLDHMAAFRIGVNLILKVADVEKMPLLLDRLIKDHEAFYAAFINELTKRGTSSV